VFYAELNELLTRELAEDGYSGVEVRVTPIRTEIIIRATRTQSVLGEWPWKLVGARTGSAEPAAAVAAVGGLLLAGSSCASQTAMLQQHRTPSPLLAVAAACSVRHQGGACGTRQATCCPDCGSKEQWQVSRQWYAREPSYSTSCIIQPAAE
jgi:hypothetical protein